MTDKMNLPGASLNEELIEFLGSTIPERAQVAKELLLVLRGFGLRSVYSNLTDSDLDPIGRLRSCQTLDLLLTTGRKWLQNDKFGDAIKNLKRRDATVRILLSRQRMDEKRYLYDEYKHLLSDASMGDILQIRIYDEKPVFRAIITNGTELILSHYHYKDEEKANHGWETPQLRFEQVGEYSLTGPFNQVFKRIWDGSEPLLKHEGFDRSSQNANNAAILGTVDRKDGPSNIFILTSNENENRAVLEELQAVAIGGELDTDVSIASGFSKVSAKVQTKYGTAHIDVAIARETGGAIAANLLRRRASNNHSLDAVFVIGCAGLLAEKYGLNDSSMGEFPRGLVILAKKASDGDARLVEDAGSTSRGDGFHGDRRLIEAFRTLNGMNAFEADGITLVTNREFISTAAFIASKDSEERKRLVDQFVSDAIVVENEAFAIYDEVQNIQSESGRILPCLVIKGISDLGDEEAFEDKVTKQKQAASNAAKVVLRLVIEQ